MLSPRLAVCIVHAEHVESRRPLYQRLMDRLGLLTPESDRTDGLRWTTETTRGPFWVWQERTLEWFAQQAADGYTHAVTLQDDVLPMPGLWSVLNAMAESLPSTPIGFDCCHPGARIVYQEGEAGYTTDDAIIGIGHMLPMSFVHGYRRWRLEELRPGALERVSEDTLLGLFCLAKGHRIFSPVPSPIDHDLEIASVYANEAHAFRKPQVSWMSPVMSPMLLEAMTDPGYWRPRGNEFPHVGPFYDSSGAMAALVLKDRVEAERLLEQHASAQCPPKYARFFSRVLGIGG